MGKLGFKEEEGLPRFPCRQKEKEKKIILSLRRISRYPPSFLSPPPPLPTYRCSVISLSLSLSISFREFPEVSRVGCRGFRLECRCRHSTLASCLALPLSLSSLASRSPAPNRTVTLVVSLSRSLALPLDSRFPRAQCRRSLVVSLSRQFRCLDSHALAQVSLLARESFSLGFLALGSGSFLVRPEQYL